MVGLRIFLFGRFSLLAGEGESIALDSRKVEELFCYLLLNRQRPQNREKLADLLWPEVDAIQSRNYLRKALWKLQGSLEKAGESQAAPVLLADTEWIQVNRSSSFWLDLEQFEAAYAGVKNLPGRSLDGAHIEAILAAVDLYRGDLLDGYYSDWCLFERERLQFYLLSMLDKLMDYYEAQRQYEEGLHYGQLILRYDRAREHTHCRLMRLHYLAGNRTAAIRQYETCALELMKELGVTPSTRTEQLLAQIRSDQPAVFAIEQDMDAQNNDYRDQVVLAHHGQEALQQFFTHLSQFQNALDSMQEQLKRDLEGVKMVFRNKH